MGILIPSLPKTTILQDYDSQLPMATDKSFITFICDQLALVPAITTRYPGAKPYFLVADGLEDREWLARVVEATVRDLPEPAPRKPRRSKTAPKA